MISEENTRCHQFENKEKTFKSPSGQKDGSVQVAAG